MTNRWSLIMADFIGQPAEIESPPSNLKVCKACQQALPREAFYAKRAGDGSMTGVTARCKKCQVAYHRALKARKQGAGNER